MGIMDYRYIMEVGKTAQVGKTARKNKSCPERAIIEKLFVCRADLPTPCQISPLTYLEQNRQLLYMPPVTKEYMAAWRKANPDRYTEQNRRHNRRVYEWQRISREFRRILYTTSKFT